MGSDGAVIQLVTRCTSVDEFIERFARFTTETEVVVPALPHVTVGTAGHFIIYLKDRSVMMKGRCEVTEIRPLGAAGPALMRLRVREMDAHSCGIHLRLMERHAASASAPVMPIASDAVPVATPAVDVSAVTVVGGGRPPAETEKTAVSPPPRPEERVPGAALTLPANPLGDLDAGDLASFVELTLLESNGAGERAAAGARAATTGLARVRRSARRAIPYAAWLVTGVLVGILFRTDPKASAVAVKPDLAPPPPAEPVAAALIPAAEPEFEPKPEPDREPEPSSVASERQKLTRLVVTSTPPRAFVKVNKRRIGPTPSEIETQRFKRVHIEASLPGYRRWKKTLVLTEAESQVDIKLVRLRAPIARDHGRRPPAVAPPATIALR